MRRSKLEAYEDIICLLTEKAQTIDDIAFECSMNCINLQERLNFLVQNNIADIEVSRDNRAFYVLTRRGLTISKTLAVTKRLEKLQAPRKNSRESYLQTLPVPAEQEGEETNRNY